MERLLKLLDTNARLTTAEMATMLGTTEDAVKAQMAELEKAGVVRGYKALIDWDRTDRKYVTALIELHLQGCGDVCRKAAVDARLGRFDRDTLCAAAV